MEQGIHRFICGYRVTRRTLVPIFQIDQALCKYVNVVVLPNLSGFAHKISTIKINKMMNFLVQCKRASLLSRNAVHKSAASDCYYGVCVAQSHFLHQMLLLMFQKWRRVGINDRPKLTKTRNPLVNRGRLQSTKIASLDRRRICAQSSLPQEHDQIIRLR